MQRIYHIALEADWEHAQHTGEYQISTRGRTLDEEGFIHCCQAHQVTTVANELYRGQDHVLLLIVDSTRITSPIRYVRRGVKSELFPVIYGPIIIDWVVEVTQLNPDAAGTFVYP